MWRLFDGPQREGTEPLLLTRLGHLRLQLVEPVRHYDDAVGLGWRMDIYKHSVRLGLLVVFRDQILVENGPDHIKLRRNPR